LHLLNDAIDVRFSTNTALGVSDVFQSFDEAFGKDGTELPIAQMTAPIGFLLAFALEKCLLSNQHAHHPVAQVDQNLVATETHDEDDSEHSHVVRAA
jgi:hypothetical protein